MATGSRYALGPSSIVDPLGTYLLLKVSTLALSKKTSRSVKPESESLRLQPSRKRVCALSRSIVCAGVSRHTFCRDVAVYPPSPLGRNAPWGGINQKHHSKRCNNIYMTLQCKCHAPFVHLISVLVIRFYPYFTASWLLCCWTHCTAVMKCGGLYHTHADVKMP